MTEMLERKEIILYNFDCPTTAICICCKQEVDLQREAHPRFYGNIHYWPGYTECGKCLDKRHGYIEKENSFGP